MNRPRQPCGTEAAYRRHHYHRQRPCLRCVAAHSAYAAKLRAQKPAEPRELQPCGTPAAYRRHLRRGEYACGPCLAAHCAAVKVAKQAGAVAA